MKAIVRQMPIALMLLMLSSAKGQNSQTPSDVIGKEAEFWRLYADGDVDGLRSLLSKDFLSVEEHISTGDEFLGFLTEFHQHCRLAPVKLLDPHVVFLSADIATLVYRTTETPTCGTHTMSGDTNITTVWVRRDGRWQMHLHTEYAVPPK